MKGYTSAHPLFDRLTDPERDPEPAQMEPQCPACVFVEHMERFI